MYAPLSSTFVAHHGLSFLDGYAHPVHACIIFFGFEPYVKGKTHFLSGSGPDMVMQFSANNTFKAFLTST